MASDSPLETLLTEVDDEGLLFRALFRWKGHDGSAKLFNLLMRGNEDPTSVESEMLLFMAGERTAVRRQTALSRLTDTVATVVLPLLTASDRGAVSSTLIEFPCVWVETHDGKPRARISDAEWDDEPAYVNALRPATQICPPQAVLYHSEEVHILEIFATGSRDTFLVGVQGHLRVLRLLQPINRRLNSATFICEAEALYQEIATLLSIPHHPNIVKPPTGYLTQMRGTERLVYGFLTEYYDGGCLRDIELQCIPLPTLVGWASQIVNAVHHIHHVAHTFHGDIKLDNVVLDDQNETKLIDFEQLRANSAHLAPEAQGGWDAHVDSETRQLTYDRHIGDRDRSWNAFTAWTHIPRALEIAEVHAMGFALRELFGGRVPAQVAAHIDILTEPNPLRRMTLTESKDFFDRLDSQCHHGEL